MPETIPQAALSQHIAVLGKTRGGKTNSAKLCIEQLIAAYPEAVEREALGEATGYQRSSRDAYLQRMRAKQLIEEPGRGTVRASENLF